MAHRKTSKEPFFSPKVELERRSALHKSFLSMWRVDIHHALRMWEDRQVEVHASEASFNKSSAVSLCRRRMWSSLPCFFVVVVVLMGLHVFMCLRPVVLIPGRTCSTHNYLFSKTTLSCAKHVTGHYGNIGAFTMSHMCWNVGASPQMILLCSQLIATESTTSHLWGMVGIWCATCGAKCAAYQWQPRYSWQGDARCSNVTSAVTLANSLRGCEWGSRVFQGLNISSEVNVATEWVILVVLKEKPSKVGLLSRTSQRSWPCCLIRWRVTAIFVEASTTAASMKTIGGRRLRKRIGGTWCNNSTSPWRSHEW